MVEERLAKDKLTFRPVTINEWPDLQLLFAEKGPQNGCWCMYWRIRRSECQRKFGEGNKRALQEIIESGKVPGILAYLDGQPIGWCSIAPREEFSVLDRSPTLKRVDDEPVWSIVCFFISKPHRRSGLTRALIEAAIGYAKANGARIVEAYPLNTVNTKYLEIERYTGVISTFQKAGFKEVARRSNRRPIMRYYIHGQPS
jgi:GNAT superfamily N-acetyltransferase